MKFPCTASTRRPERRKATTGASSQFFKRKKWDIGAREGSRSAPWRRRGVEPMDKIFKYLGGTWVLP